MLLKAVSIIFRFKFESRSIIHHNNYKKSSLLSTWISLLTKSDSVVGVGVSPSFEITVVCGLKFYWYLRTLSLKFQKARTKIEIFLSLPCWLSQLNWDSQKGRDRKISILLVAFWNFKLRSSNTPETVDLDTKSLKKIPKSANIHIVREPKKLLNNL